MILRHLEGIGTIKKFGFKFFIFFLIASPILASETTISERPDFENLVKDKKLERFLISLSVTGDGKIEGISNSPEYHDTNISPELMHVSIASRNRFLEQSISSSRPSE